MATTKNARDIFLDALDAAPADRAAYLDEACGDDAALRQRVEALLRANDDPGAFLSEAKPGVGDAAPLPPIEAGDATCTHAQDRQPTTEEYGDPTARVGAILAGKYKLIEEIGAGGMGSVFMAQQTEPVKRAVAVKVIKAGMDSKAVLARFEAERQALALMDHPNIAKVLDAGTTEGGRPFFVMELVKGMPITQYCDDHKLTPRQRLELFVPVCQAIQHAHQKGIIHRDIKPSNVLVALYDDRPVPKVIDFGVAKAAGPTLTDKTLMTGFGAVVGTAEYMSPEQANLNNLDIDTRSDVYSLGVLLYELLTGSTPVDRKSLGQAALLEILRIVREVEAPRLSAKLSTSDTLLNVAANRGTEPTKLSKLLKGELDWLVLKALEKDRTRRYDTANALSRDIQRYLADEVVEARPPSRGYRLKKFVRRHSGQVLAASLVLFALLAGIAGTTWQAIRAENARAAEKQHREAAEENERKAVAAAEKEEKARLEAENARTAEKKQREAAEENERKAIRAAEKEEKARLETQAATELTAARLKQIETINNTVFDIFTEFDIRKVKKGNAPVEAVLAEKLIEAGKKLDAKAIHDPLVLANLQNRLGLTLLHLGQAPAAIELLRAAVEVRKEKLGADDPDTITSMNNLALGYDDAGKLDKALPLFEETLRLQKAKLGADHPDTLLSMNNLAMGYLAAGKLDKAVPLLEVTLKLTQARFGPDHSETLTSMGNLATGYEAAGNLDKALPLFEKSLALMRAKFAADHSDTLIAMGNLAGAYREAGKLDKALPLYEETLKLKKAKFGPDHPETLGSMGSLALGYFDDGKLDKALPLLEETLKLQKAKLGADHPDTLGSMNNLAMGYQAAGKTDEALRLMEETLKLMKAKLGADHPDTLTNMNNLAGVYWNAKRLDRSIPLFEETLKLTEAKLGRKHPDTLKTVANLGVNYKDAGRLKEAIPLLEEAYQESKKHASLRFVWNQLLDTYAKAGESAKFANVFKELLPDIRKLPARDRPYYAGMFASVSLSLLDQKQWTAAEPLLRECLAIREKTQPDAWTTFSTQSMLGGALLGQKKYIDAEPLLLKGYEGMKKREKTIPEQGKVRVTEAIDRLIELYTATKKPDEVKKWQAERTKDKEVAPLPRQTK